MGGDQGFNREPQTARCVTALSARPTAMKSEKVVEMRSERGFLTSTYGRPSRQRHLPIVLNTAST
jgi:N-formylglutamate amidohydrolase